MVSVKSFAQVFLFTRRGVFAACSAKVDPGHHSRTGRFLLLFFLFLFDRMQSSHKHDKILCCDPVTLKVQVQVSHGHHQVK